jgi:uncharacterized protein YejL (UPF0352 family)
MRTLKIDLFELIDVLEKHFDRETLALIILEIIDIRES